MYLEGTSLCTGEVALFAIKRLLSTVNQYMSFQLRSTYGRVDALVATVGLFFIMLKHMCFEVCGHIEVEIAMNT